MSTALEEALRILRNPGVGKDLPTVTEAQREQLQSLAAQMLDLMDQMSDVVPDIDLADIIHELGAMGRDLENIVTNRVALETKEERRDRRYNGDLTDREFRSFQEDDPDCYEMRQYHDTHY